MIRLENLTKLYGSFVAVDDITLHVARGVLYVLIGVLAVDVARIRGAFTVLLAADIGRDWNGKNLGHGLRLGV